MTEQELVDGIVKVMTNWTRKKRAGAYLILDVLARNGYVRLADDQSLPSAFDKSGVDAQRDLLDLGWRRVQPDETYAACGDA